MSSARSIFADAVTTRLLACRHLRTAAELAAIEPAWGSKLHRACPFVLYAHEDESRLHPIYIGHTFWPAGPVMAALRGYDVVRFT